MAGLLDFFNTEDGRMALGLLAAGAPRAGGRQSIGGGLLESLNGVDAWKQQKAAQEGAAQDRALKQQMLQAQMADVQAQQQQREAQARQLQQAALRQQAFQGALAGGSRVGTGEAMAQGGGPTPQAAAQLGQPKAMDWNALAMQFPDQIDQIKKLAEANNFGRNKVARVEETMVDGRPVKQQFDDYGGVVGSALPQWKPPKEIDTGGQIWMLDPVTMKILTQFKKSQTPDSVASNSLGYARLAHDKQQAANSAAAGQLVQDAEGAYVRVGKDNRATPIMAPSGVQPLLGKGAGMTEDQGKATGWLVQAESAYKNMKSAMAANPGASMPGLNDVLAKVPMMGPVANSMRGEERQRFLQSSESFHEAVLRAATGAGVNKDEAAQKARELTPQLGDSQAVINQKMAAYPVYIESLKVRAGPGAKKAAGISSQQAPASGGVKFLGFE